MSGFKTPLPESRRFWYVVREVMKTRHSALTLSATLLVLLLCGGFLVLTVLPIRDNPWSRNHALAQVNVLAIRTAIDQYVTTYDAWPASPTNYTAILGALRGENSNSTVFLTFDNDSILDPWEQPYHIEFDHDGDGVLPLAVTNLKLQVAVWSSGRNGKNEYGEQDDIRSW